MAVSKENLDQLATTLLIPNLHCPSCVSAIETALESLHPKPLAISPSIVSRSITVSHKVALSTEDISKALEDAGFEVYDTFQDPLYNQPLDHVALQKKYGVDWTQRFESSVKKWSRQGRGAQGIHIEEKMRHINRCEECQAATTTNEGADVATPLRGLCKQEKPSLEKQGEIEVNGATTKPTDIEDGSSRNPFVVIDSLSNQAIFQATFLIEDMT